MPFLTAEWRHLALVNYEVDPALVHPWVPRGTELDSWSGRTFVSLVGFLFARTRVLGNPIPFHGTFEEVNVRFYVRRTIGGEVRRAVTFIRELVPRTLVARVARLAYNEPYVCVPMRHAYAAADDIDAPGAVEYAWRGPAGWCSLQVEPTGTPALAQPRSFEEFIIEHYWGYTRQRDGSTIEYQVTHPTWRVWPVKPPRLLGDLASVYGPVLGGVLSSTPASAFYADGSAVAVGFPRRLNDARRR